MSYKSRQKKRERGAQLGAQNRGQEVQRALYPDRWYITIATRNGCCNQCGGSLRKNAEIVYRHEPQEVLCVPCSQLQGIAPRPSVSWERRNRQRRKGRSS